MKYDVVIGLEVHVQIKTNSKMFCSCPNTYGEEPNLLTCPVCMGYPGAMPSPNYVAIKKTVMTGMMIGCEIPSPSKFDRKSYFYPDMPKNYQISQYDLPLCINGRLHIHGKGFSGESLNNKHIGITRIHLEEDVAKLTHLKNFSGIDYNRAGVPLMEIVSEPDISSADEAYAYLVALKEIMQYGDISACDMEKGQMRCDVNISLKVHGASVLGTKIEIKNLNSFRAVHRAIGYEIERQTGLLDLNVKLQQETRGWNDDRFETYLMRTKENAHDYRYFPEPDLMPIIFTQSDIDDMRKLLPELPDVRRKRFIKDYNLSDYDAQLLTSDKGISEYFDKAVKLVRSPKILANWVISELLREIPQNMIEMEHIKIRPEDMAELVNLIDDNTINGKIAKTIFADMLLTGEKPSEIIKVKNLTQVTDESAIEKFVDSVITEFPAQVQQFKDGKEAVMQFLVGQVMKQSKGKASPQLVQKILRMKLG